jgi:hypothetical protein
VEVLGEFYRLVLLDFENSLVHLLLALFDLLVPLVFGVHEIFR